MSILERLGLPSPSVVLDVGFRRVEELVTISSLIGEQGTVLGIEPDQSLVEGAVALAKEIKNVHPLTGDSYNLPLATESVDIVIFKGVLHEIVKPLKALHDARRVCRAEGKIMIIDFTAFPRRWQVTSNLKVRLRRPRKTLKSSLDKHPGFARGTIEGYLQSSDMILERFESNFTLGRYSGHAIPMFLASARKG